MNSQLRNMIRRLNLLSSASIKEEERYHCHSDDVEFHCKMLSDADVADVVHVWAIQRPRDSKTLLRVFTPPLPATTRTKT
eukprot:scaffold5798_cov118-Skeletonema_dohrnii-CCMP3373.AAC.2